MRYITFLLLILLNKHAFSQENQLNIGNEFITRKAIKKVIKEKEEIKNRPKENSKVNNFSGFERMQAMQQISDDNKGIINDVVNIQVPLIWYMEKF